MEILNKPKERSFVEFQFLPNDDVRVVDDEYTFSIQVKSLIKVIVLKYE